VFVLIDNSSGAGSPSLMFAEPTDVVVANEASEVRQALQRIEAALGQGLHAAGFFSYELGYALEPRLAARMPSGRSLPLICFGLFRQPSTLTEQELLELIATQGGPARLGPIVPDWDAKTYGDRFALAHEKIASGDIYQLNLTFKVRFQLNGPPLALYRDLRLRQPVAYGAFIDTGNQSILSLSPELFFIRDGSRIESRPMKGTAARGATVEADARARDELASDFKQRAENLMIVDLMRNDIGRMAEIGSVTVSDLFTVETFKTVHQMTSGVHAQLRAGTSVDDLLGALFPPGSVTGAPKIRAMELIADLESGPRGVYCGAIGYFGPNNLARFNVAIRTPVIDRAGRGEMGIGSAVVADSQGSAEYQECLLKMKFLDPVADHFDLIETLLYEPQKGFWLLEGHMARLSKSAHHFNFAYDEAKVRIALIEAVALSAPGHSRVRLLLSRSGVLRAEAFPLGPANEAPAMRYVIADHVVQSSDIFLAHKTTNRHRYDADWKCVMAKGGDEVLYCNERGELTEGSRTNIFIKRGDQLLTPPLACGVLAGVLRAELLATGRAIETVLWREDLQHADAVFLGNSVRGLVKAYPMGGSPP
jgi:para-aminobenzoate synthetase / 4-amino-4-deoxychorismate lyase